MHHGSMGHPVPSRARDRVPLVSDWDLDPQAVVDATQRQPSRRPVTSWCQPRGDPEQIAAIGDALADWPVQALLLCAPRGRLGAPYPFDL